MRTIDIKTGSREPNIFHCFKRRLILFISVFLVNSLHAVPYMNNPCQGEAGDPVGTLFGELIENYCPDINLGGPMPLFFQRNYGSLTVLGGFISGNLGNNWLHTFDMKLSTSGTTTSVVDNRSRFITFNLVGGNWVLQPGVSGNFGTAYQLATSGVNFVFLNPINNISYTFNTAGQLMLITDGKGNTHTLSYNASGQLTQVTDGIGRTLTFGYAPLPAVGIATLAFVSDGTRSINFAYTGSDLTSVTDARGNVTRYSYSVGSLMTTETRPAGNISTTQVWDFASRVISQTDGNGNTITLAYAGNTTITDPLGGTKVHSHTAQGGLSNDEDEAGVSVVIGSDAAGRRNSITDRLGNITTYAFHPASSKQQVINHADGTSTTFTYSSRTVDGVTLFDKTGITYSDTSTEGFVFDASGNLTVHTDQAGFTATSSYNLNGQPLTISNFAGGVETHTYKIDGTKSTTTDPAGNTTTFGYDVLKRRNLIIFADGSTVSYTRDNLDNFLTQTDRNGNTTLKTYNANGNIQTSIDSIGNTTTFAYDGNDRPTVVTDPLGGNITTTYDPLGRVATVTDANGNITQSGYDAQGRQISLTDPLGNIWASTYDAEGVMSSSTDPIGNTTTFTSDSMGRNIQTRSPMGSTRNLTYDVMGRIATSTSALGQQTTLGYNMRGMLTNVTLPGPISATYTHDALGKITQAIDPNGNKWNHAFDNQGRQSSSTDPLGNIIGYSYDKRNQISQVTFPGGMGTQTISYDAVGNVTSHNYSDGTAFGFTYDANNRFLTANNGGVTPNNITRSYNANGFLTNSNGIAITRDGGGRITSMTLAPGKTITYAYDVNDQLISVIDWTPAPGNLTSFSYDVAGKLINISRSNGINNTSTYDNDSRLIGLVEGTVASIILTRDVKGQITTASRTLPQATTATGLISKAITVDAGSQITTNTYDRLGRTTASDNNSYTWDLASRLVNYTQAGMSATATYDARGFRLSRTVAADTRNYVWNQALVLPSISIEKQGATDLRYYVHTPSGKLLYSIDASSNLHRFYHFDEMGNTIFVSNDTGVVIGSYAYSPFGQLSASTGNLDNPFTWQGQIGVMDDGEGLYYIRTRYYDSQAQRFITRDPLESRDPRSINPYQYALGNPLKYVDPMGSEESNWFFDTFIPWLSSSSGTSAPANPPALGQETLGQLSDIYNHTIDPNITDPEELVKQQARLDARAELFGNTAKFADASTALISAGCPAPGSSAVSLTGTASMAVVSTTAGAAASNPGLIERGFRAAARIIFFWD